MNVYWLTQNEEQVPLADDWLSEAERICLNGFRFPKRRREWRLGRWTAKCAVAARLGLGIHPDNLRKLEIVASSSGAPTVLVPQGPSLTISISHRSETGLCATADDGVELGCDVEWIEERSKAFIEDYFTIEEQACIANACPEQRSTLATVLWSAKESALKALQAGLRLDTRSVNVKIAPESSLMWSPIVVHCQGGDIFHGWWRIDEKSIYTVVSHPAPNAPLALHLDTGAETCHGRILQT